MKCIKCGEEWTAPPDKSVNFCPNCGVPTQTQTSTVLSTDNVIKSLVTTNNLKDKLFLDPSRLHALAADELKGSKSEVLEYIKLAVIKKVPQELYALKSVDSHERQLKMNVLLNSLMERFNERTSYEIVNLFAEALGFNLLLPSPPSLPLPRIGELYHFTGRDWRVLEIKNGKALILSEKIIGEGEYDGIENTWANCRLQSSLNGVFYNSFGQEKFRIAKTRIVTADNPWHGTDGGKDIDNWIFLLSIEEVVQYLCGIQNVQEYLDKGKAADVWGIDDNYNIERKACGDADVALAWWLRSPGSTSGRVACVRTDGSLSIRGCELEEEIFGWNNNSRGVRPALWLNL